MSGNALKKYIGRRCQLVTILEKKIVGIIVNIEGNWVEIEVRNNSLLINTDFIERFEILPMTE